jgi:hypothetical protein
MKKAGEFIKSLLDKAGFDTNSKSFIDLLSKSEFSNTDIPDEISETISTKLITTEQAKNDPVIKSHFTAMALDPFNTNVEKWLKDNGIEDAEIKEITADKSTYKKVEKAIEKIKEAKEKAAKSGSGKDIQEYQQKLNALTQQIAGFEKEKADAVNEVVNRYETQIFDQEVNSILRSKPLPGTLAPDIELTVARQLIEKSLAEKNARAKKIDGKIRIVSKDDENIFIFGKDGKELSFDSLTEQTLADNKFLKVSTPQTPANNGGQHRQSGGQQNDQPQLNQASLDALQQLDESLSKVG